MTHREERNSSLTIVYATVRQNNPLFITPIDTMMRMKQEP